MERWDNKSLSKDQINRHRRENPSFSSTLLDAIYRSIDEGGGEEGKGLEEMVFSKEMLKKREGVGSNVREGKKLASYEKACMIEKWMMEKKASEKDISHRKSMENIGLSLGKDWNPKLVNSTSSSSDSSSGGGFSSSESDSIISGGNSRSSSYKMHRPKPIRTGASTRSEPMERAQLDGYGSHAYHYERSHNNVQGQKSKHHDLGSFVKSKSKALKIYGDLKKGNKQPISPGGRLASFLNSLFTTGNNGKKKAKISTSISGGYGDDLNNISGSDLKSKSGYESTCSSASSFSRSCLSKTPSSRGNLSNNNGTKRSVRFYPVSVIVDEDCQPCGEKKLYETEPIVVSPLVTTSLRSSSAHKDSKFNIMEGNSRLVEDAAREILMNYQNKKENYSTKNDVIDDEESEDEDDDDDDAASCSSSDLFELDNLSAIGIERYREELPVYETTHIDTNRAIASGLIV